jgi:preprotein translocase subunit SecE
MQLWDKIKTFLEEVRTEMGKITWPSREDLKESTWVVIVSVFFLSIILGVVDRILSTILGQVLKLVV